MATKSKTMTAKALAANKANASKPRGRRPSTLERDAIDEAKALGRSAIPAGIAFLIGVLQCTVRRQVVTEAGLFDAEPTIEQRVAAFRELANRCGLPVRTDVDMSTAPPLFLAIEGFAEDPPGAK